MKGFFLKILLLFVILSLGVFIAEAGMVHYYDENGNIHYVNTEVSQVPARYRSQVQDQLAEMANENREEEASNSPSFEQDEDEFADFEESEDEESETNDIDDKSEKSFNDPRIMFEMDGYGSTIIELFHAKGCDQCRYAEILLRAQRVHFKRIDVDKTEYGQQIYDEVGGPLPIVKIGTDYVRGYEPQEIIQLISTALQDPASFQEKLNKEVNQED